MINLGDEIIVKTEKLTSSGEAIARIGEEKFVIFISGAMPNEEVKIKVVSKNKNFLKAETIEIIKPSSHRIKAFCPIYNACGSCNFQNCDYDFQIEQKNILVKEIFKNIADNITPIIKSPDTKTYRHKVQYQARQTNVSKRVMLGYFKNKSHNLTDIKFCPIQPEIINKISQFIRENYTLGCYSEKTNKGLLKNILFRISNYSGEILLTFVLNLKENEYKFEVKNKITDFSKKLMLEFKEIKGAFVNLNYGSTNKILSDINFKISGEDFIEEHLENKIFKIGATSFFQINPKSAVNLFNIVKNNIKENSSILDAYGGVGAIGIFCSDKAKSITLVEENKNATDCARKNFELNNIKNYKILTGDAKKQFLKLKTDSIVFDYVILDPPRSGCNIKDGGLNIISSLAKNIIYVSCNPITLKRDAVYLIENGFKIKSLHSVDLFPHTFHIECVAVFEKI